MYQDSSRKRGYKGSVSIINSSGRLQLRFHYAGKRYYLSTGWLDTSGSRKLAEFKAAEIEKDILYERLDETLAKYKPGSSLSIVTNITVVQKPKPQLDKLWDKYSEFKKPQISPSTYAKDFTKHRNHIAKLATRSLDEASAIQDHLLSNLTPDAAKRCLTQLKACCNWAMDKGLIDANPFAAMKIKVPKGAYKEQDIHPLCKEERDLIIRIFASDCHYTFLK
ncbi:MAG: DUF3596 domain-containing protein [Nostoc sp.]|uniref:Arm DNA-binding domain-containing protein n=1 Tax=Nostoc sp. TaxID=1180 RepID=UPI002FFAD0BB